MKKSVERRFLLCIQEAMYGPMSLPYLQPEGLNRILVDYQCLCVILHIVCKYFCFCINSFHCFHNELLFLFLKMGAKKAPQRCYVTLPLFFHSARQRKISLWLKQSYLPFTGSDIPLIASFIILFWIVVLFCMAVPPFLFGTLICFNG